MTNEDDIDLDNWRQGDFALAPIELPLVSLEDGEPAIIFADAEHGVVLLTQSCDVVRPQTQKPYVQVAALVRVEPQEMARVRVGHAPSRVHLEGLVDRGLVVDLEVTATIDKEVVAKWVRDGGCRDDAEQRRFATALARHRQRFAFPDKFNELVTPVKRWIESKRSADSSNGRLIRAIREIRVLADNWDAPTTVEFLVLLDEPPPAAEEKDWEAAMGTLTKKGTHPAYPVPEFRLVVYDDLSARDYKISDRLDWDGLSDAA